MNRKNKISTGNFLRSLILLVMMGWMGSAWAQDATTSEQLLYSTDFTEWTEISHKTATNTEVKKKTEGSNEELTFTLNGVGVAPKGRKEDKFPNYTGYMITAKYTTEYSKSEPSAVTSPLKSITRIELTQAATGGERGIKVSVKGDGDGDWVVLHDKYISNAKGETLILNVNRKNCQIKFETLALAQNAYIVDLKIYGNVDYTVTYYDTDGTTSLGSESVTANSNLKYNTEYTNQVKQNVPSGSAFRGWFNGTDPSAEKVAEGTPVDMDLNLYPKVTPIETAKDSSEYTYDLTKNNFYQEDHELIEINGGQYHHDGWLFENEGTILLQVAKNAHIEMTTSTGTTTIDHMGGVPTTLTLDIPVGTVVKNLQVKNYIPVDVSNVVITKTISNADKNTYPNEKPENAGTVQITKQTAEGNTGTRYEVGDKVTITTTPSTCYTFQEFKQDGKLLETSTSFEYTVKDGINNIEVIYKRQQLYQVIVKPSDPNRGTVSLSPRYDNFYNEKYNEDKGEVTQIECWYTKEPK